MDFLIAKDDLHRCRFEEGQAPEPGAGQALLAVRAFGLTSNNITYDLFAVGNRPAYGSTSQPTIPEGHGRRPVRTPS